MTDTSGFVVAVVDDDDSVLYALKNLLESADYAARVFASADALLESNDLAEVDCLISDIDMPGMDGFELVRKVHLRSPDLPVILITGHPEMLQQSQHVDPRAYEVFNKPFEGHKLLKAVSEALLRRKAGARDAND
jgi:FixJ family two-component response regulator